MKKKLNGFRPKVRSRHPSHEPLRTRLPLLPFRSVVRMGSTTDLEDTVTNGGKRIECNTIEAVKNSSDKGRMKMRFNADAVPTALWYTVRDNRDPKFYENGVADQSIKAEELPYPVVVKHRFGSRNQGNWLIKDKEELIRWIDNRDLSRYIIEKFYNFSREYRLHVTAEGCFYTCRKMLKQDTPAEQRWYRNDSNSVWIVEENEQFDKPVNWDKIIEDSVKALNAVGLDIGAVDLKIQSSKDNKERRRENPEYIILEINSAPSFGDITTEKYLEEIPKVLTAKFRK